MSFGCGTAIENKEGQIMKKTIIRNPRYPHYIRIVRRELPEDEFSGDEMVESLVWEGCGRGYTDTTTTGTTELDLNKRKASIPVRFDKWGGGEDKPYPIDGDIMTVRKGAVTEEWRVRDFESDNDRTVVYAELNRLIGV